MISSNSTRIPFFEFFKQENWYNDLFIKYADPRTVNFFLLRTPEPMIAIVILYLLFVYLTPKIMKNRQPFNLKKLIIVYNFALVGLSGYMCLQFLVTATLLNYSYACAPLDWEYKTDTLNMRIVNASWLFFFSKIIELTDTIFFMLRKKNDQVSFLHVYHHSTMIINWWMAVKYVPVGQSFFVGVINSFIHTIMYMYYALAALGPSMQKYLWWKRYMTKMQLIQFILVVSHTGYNMFIADCDYPYLFNAIVFYYTWSMLFLFLNFYYQTYIRRTPRSGADKAAKMVDKSHLNGTDKYVNGVTGAGDMSNDVRSRKSQVSNGMNN